MVIDASDARAVSVSMLAPNREQCGISDFSRSLIAAMGDLPSVKLIRCLEPPDSAASQSHLSAIASRSSRADQFRRIGASLSEPPAQLTHVQHEYSLFGGVAPHRNLAATFYASVTVPIVLTVHEIVSESGGAIRTAALRHANRANFVHPAIRAWIVHTDADRDRLAVIGVNRKSIHVVPMGVPTVQLHADREGARARLGLTDKRVVTLFGFLSAKKGHPDAIEAISRMPDDVVLVLAGGKHPDDHTGYVSRIESDIEQRKMSQRVRITGYLPPHELQVVMAATDIAIAPYIQSSGSASVAYLLGAGIPVIASDIPSFREIETEMPGTLALVGPHSPDLLTAELLKVLSSPGQLQALRNAATRYAAAHTYRSMAEATVKVYVAALA